MSFKNGKNIVLNEKMNELVSFENEDDKLEFDIIIMHLKAMEVIKQLLLNKKKNRLWLSEQLSVSKGYISQLFSGDKLLNLKLLVKINKIFNSDITIINKNYNSFVMDVNSSVIDLSKIHPGFLGSQKYEDVQKSNDPIPIYEVNYNLIRA